MHYLIGASLDTFDCVISSNMYTNIIYEYNVLCRCADAGSLSLLMPSIERSNTCKVFNTYIWNTVQTISTDVGFVSLSVRSTEYRSH